MTTEPTIPLPVWARWFRRGLVLAAGLALALLVFQSLWSLSFLARRLNHEGENSLAESRRAERAIAWAKGEPLFGDFSEWPHIGVDYGPLTYYSVGLALRLTGLPEDRWEAARRAFLLGRCLSFLSMLGLLAWLVAMARLGGLRGFWPFLPPLLFFSSRFIFQFADAYRSDFPMMLFALWAWYAALRGKGEGGAVAAGLLMTVAFCHKPPALASAALLGLCLLVGRDYRRAVFYASSFVLSMAVAHFWSRWIAGGTIDISVVKASPHFPALWKLPALLLRPYIMILPLAGGLAALPFLWRERKNRPESADQASKAWKTAGLAFAGGLTAVQLMVLRPGSNIYYYLEPWCWGCLLTAWLARKGYESLGLCLNIEKRGAASDPLKRFARAAIWTLALLAALLGYSQRASRLWSERDALQAPVPWREKNAALAPILRETRGPVLMDDAFPWWFTQSPPTLMMALGWSTAVRAGGLSSRSLEMKIEDRDFELILLTYDASRGGQIYQGVETFPPSINRAITQNYQMEYIEPYYLYRPIPRR